MHASQYAAMERQAHDDVRRILDDLEARLDPAAVQAIRERHMRAATWQPVDRPPVILVRPWDGSRTDLYPVAEAVADPSKMLANELRRGFSAAAEWLEIRDDKPLQIRPDFGIGLVSSVFGARIEVVENNPPWVFALDGEKEAAVTRALDAFDCENCHTRGWVPRVTETLDYTTTVLRDYPAVASSVAVTLPDLQGPFDNAAMLWGCDIFLALATEADLVDRLLTATGDAMVHLHDHLRRWVGRELLPEGFSHQHGTIVRGNLLLRCDSNVMVSPGMYASQILVHDRRVLAAVGTGSFHSCGRWKQNIPAVLDAAEVGSLDFGTNQSNLNEIDAVHREAASRKKHLNLVTVEPDELESRSVLERFPTGATLCCAVDSVDRATAIMRTYAS